MGIFFSLRGLTYLRNLFIQGTSPRTWCAGGTGNAIGIAFLVAFFLEAVDFSEIGAIMGSVESVATNGKGV